jgi:hypothetical protein
LIFSALSKIYKPKINKIPPCKISPNITPKRKGNVIIVKRPGFNS